MSWSAPAFGKDPVFREYSQSSKAAVDGMQSVPRYAFEENWNWIPRHLGHADWNVFEIPSLDRSQSWWRSWVGKTLQLGCDPKDVNISEPWNRGSSCPKRSSLDVSRIVELCPKHFLKKEKMVTMGGFPFGMIRSLTLENQFTKNVFFGRKNCCRFHDSTTRGASTIDVHLQAAPGWRWSYFTSGAHIPWRFCIQGRMPIRCCIWYIYLYIYICHSKLFKASCSFLTLSES